jgi:hypothetical protein
MIDLVTGLPKSSEKDTILVVVGKLTKFGQFIATTTDMSTTGITIILFKQSVKIFGMPKTIVGDRDPRWTSSVWKSLSQLMNMCLALSTSKHPQTDSQMEVMNQHLEIVLRVYVQADQKDWVNWLDILQFMYNNAKHLSHHTSPAQLLLGYKPRTPLDFLTESGLMIIKTNPDLTT